MVKMDSQLSNLDEKFALKCMERSKRQVGHMEGGCGSATSGRSRDTSSVPAPQMVQAALFPIPTTIEPLFKRVRDDEGPRNKPPQSTLATTANTISNSEEGG